MKKITFYTLCLTLFLVGNLYAQQTVWVAATAAGTADGTSQANAFGSLTNALVQINSATDILRVVGTVPAGNQNLAKAFAYTIEGDAGGSTLSGVTGVSTRMFTINAASSGQNVTFKNITFSGQNSSIAGGGAVLFSNQAGVTINFENCRFNGNTITSTTAAAAGAIYISNSTVTFTNCLFKENTAVRDGGAIGIGTGATATLTRCTFYRNKTTSATAGQGGAALFVAGTTPVVNVTNCTFFQNTTGITDQSFGTIRTNTGTTNVSNSLFFDNKLNNNANAAGDWGSAASLSSTLTNSLAQWINTNVTNTNSTVNTTGVVSSSLTYDDTSGKVRFGVAPSGDATPIGFGSDNKDVGAWDCGTRVTPTFSQVAAICSGATLSALPTTSTNGITGTWSPALNNTATTTYTFLPGVGQCALRTTMTITVNANTTTGSVTQSQVGGTYTWPANGVTYSSSAVVTIISGCNTATLNLTISSTTWAGAAWSNSAPTSSVDAIINGAYSTTTNGAISARSLTVNVTTGNLTINSGTNVTVQNGVVNNGTLTIANNANLIQVNNVANSGSGTTTVNRNGSTLKRLDYTLWSSPVASQNLKGFSSLTVDPRFYTYNEGIDKFSVVSNPAGTTFTPGRSFFIRMPDQFPADSGNQTPYYLGSTTLAFPGAFTGVLNNGDVSVTLTKALNGYQAVGNPYPSVIDATAFLNANTANIENTLYFWRKTNGASGSSYATWTLGGATSVTPTSGTPNGKIQVGQGFIVQAKNAGTVANFFTNAMRDVAPSSTQFFKVKQQAQKDRLWLNLTGANDVFSQALVAYIDDATLGLDKYDGKYINDSGIALTTSINKEEYTIQARPVFDATDVVALNFKTSVAGTYTIAIDHVDGLFSQGQDIYLVDKKLGVTTNLNEGAYNFTADAGVDNTRFELTYQKTLKVDASVFNENSVLVSRSNGTLNVKSTAVAINNVKVFDVQGRLVAERKNVKSNTATIGNLRTNQVLIVKVTSESNAVVTKKVLN